MPPEPPDNRRLAAFRLIAELNLRDIENKRRSRVAKVCGSDKGIVALNPLHPHTQARVIGAEPDETRGDCVSHLDAFCGLAALSVVVRLRHADILETSIG